MNEQDLQRYEPTREDVLIGRVSDGEATPNDWQELERLASKDGGVWSRLASAQRAHARLSEAVEDEIAVSELVGLPRAKSRVGAIISKGIGIAGWGVAAALAIIVFTGGRGMALGPGDGTSRPAGPITDATPVSFEDAADQYVEIGKREGRVLRELPSKMIDTRGFGEGNGRGVLYVRMFLERQRVDGMDVFDMQHSDSGEPVPVRSTVPEGYRSDPI